MRANKEAGKDTVSRIEEINEEEMMRIFSDVRLDSMEGAGAILLHDASVLREVWEMYEDVEALLEEVSEESMVQKVKVAISKIVGAFSIEGLENFKAGVSYALTPLADIRSSGAQGTELSGAQFKFAQPQIPGCIFSLNLSSTPHGMTFTWQISGALNPPENIKMFLNGQLQEMQSLATQEADFIVSPEESGLVQFEAGLRLKNGREKSVVLFQFEL